MSLRLPGRLPFRPGRLLASGYGVASDTLETAFPILACGIASSLMLQARGRLRTYPQPHARNHGRGTDAGGQTCQPSQLAWHAVAFCGEQLDRSRAMAEI